MAPKVELRGFPSRLKSLFRLQQRFVQTIADGGMQEKTSVETGSNLRHIPGQPDVSRWVKADSRKFGMNISMISPPSWLAIKILRYEGFEAYLVGGCVRDLILKRTPKDFDVITTAGLEEIKRIFHNAFIVGTRFPICLVNLKGSAVEVSSFGNVAIHDREETETQFTKMPKGCSDMDYVRWRDCIGRDFTINSLFYDPVDNKVYDYANAMTDLRSLKLRTLIPAHLSFKEDCARILRGLRIAARLGLSFSKETKAAICELSSSVSSLAKGRLMMELNYMLSYGAAESSLKLLQRFKVLGMLLPFHDAYLSNQGGDPAFPTSSMFVKLFSSLDKVVSCGQPCHSLLWVGLLSFHLALVTNPREPLVISAFSSILYYGNFNEGIKAAREHAVRNVHFEPEMRKSVDHLSDEELAQKVSKFSSLVQHSVYALTDLDALVEAMAKYPSSPCSGTVFVPKRFDVDVARLVDMSVYQNDQGGRKRESYDIDHFLLRKGNIPETRFVLGKIIMDTLGVGVGAVAGQSSPCCVVSPSDAETAPGLSKRQNLIEKVQEEQEVALKPAPSLRKKSMNGVSREKQANLQKGGEARPSGVSLSSLFKVFRSK